MEWKVSNNVEKSKLKQLSDVKITFSFLEKTNKLHKRLRHKKLITEGANHH